METIEKKTNPFVRAGRWIKKLFTKKSVTTAVVAHKRGQLRTKPRVIKERVKIAYYRTRNTITHALTSVKRTAFTITHALTSVKRTAFSVVDRVTALSYWPAVRDALFVVGQVVRGIVTIAALSLGLVLVTTAVVEGTVFLSLFLGEAMAASMAFVTLYLFAYYGINWIATMLESRRIDKLLENVTIDEEELADSTNLRLAHA